MATSIVATPTTGSLTLYRNRPFDISFSIAPPLAVDTSLYFSNSTYGMTSYVDNGHFKSTSGISTLGPLGTLSVDVMTTTPTLVSTVTPQTYVSANVGCTDPSGNVYFAVANQNKVFQLDLSGGVTTFAGTGIAGDTEGNRLSAQFRAPSSIATDGSGTFFVTDQYRVRKIDSNGIVSTLAGSVNRGTSDGTGSAARFYSASTVILRPTGDLLVSDDDSHCIRSVTQAGVVTTYAGTPGVGGFQNGPLLSDSNVVSTQGVQAWPQFSSMSSPGYETTNGGSTWTTPPVLSSGTANIRAAITTPADIIYAGWSNSAYGSPVTFASTQDGTTRGPVSFPSGIVDRAFGLATDGCGTLVVGGQRIAYDTSLVRSTDNGSNWSVLDASLGECRALAYGNGVWMAGGSPPYASTANLTVSSNSSTWTATAACPITTIYGLAYGGGRWVAVGQGTYTLAFSDDNGTSWTGRDPTAPAGSVGTHIVYNNGVWIAGFDNNFTPLYRSTDGDTFTAISSVVNFGASKALYYSTLTSRWFASLDGNPATSTNSTSWSSTTTTGTFVGSFVDVSFTRTTYSLNGALFYFPHGLLYDPQGNLYVADQYNNRIRIVSNAATDVSTYAGTGAATISNGTLTTAGTARPSSLARNSTGTIYVGSFERNTLQTIVGSNVSLLAGSNFSPGYVDGVPDVARFNGLGGLTVDRNNLLYISEIYNGDLRKLTTLPDVRPGLAPPGYTIVATSNYPFTVNSRIDVCWTSIGGALPLYKYEPFCNSFTANRSGGGSGGTTDTLRYSASRTELLGYLSGTGTSNVLFRGPNGATVAYPYSLSLVVDAMSNSSVVDSVSTNVTINPARIILTPCNSSLVFYRNEPSPNPVFSLESSPAQLIYSASTLPAGLSFVKTASNAFTLTGTPTVQSITSNYTILGQDTTGRTYSTQVTMLVNPERLILDVSGSLTLTGLTSNDPMSPITFTSRFPPYGLDRAVTYSWFPAPPAGLQFRRKDGIAVTALQAQVGSSIDPSFALTLSGTVTSEQILDYASNGGIPTLVFNGVRTNGGGALSPALPKTITFSFAEFVHFTESVPTLYVGRPVSNLYYSATTYFPVDTSAVTINLIDGFIPDGLDASFTPATQRFSFAGTPATAGTYGFTLEAINGRGTSAILPVRLAVSTDSVIITTTVDPCFNFIQYRPLTSEKAGSYPYPIRYTATAASGSTVSVVGANLPTGVTLASLSSGVYRLQGIPTTPTTLTTATLTGTAQDTGAVGTTTFLYSVSAEVFTFNDLSLAFSQNIPATPATVTATTLSEQPIVRYSSPSIPEGLQIANTGKITGTPLGDTSGTFEVTAFTSYSFGTKTYSYSMTPDEVLLQPAVYTTVTAPGCNVSIQINGYSASATNVSNYRVTAGSTYGLGIDLASGLLSGTLASSLPTTTTFTLAGSAGRVDGTLVGTMTTDNLTTNRAQMIEIRSNSNLYIYYSDDNGTTWGDAYSQSNLLASHIGTNGSNLYLVPTSSATVLASTTGSNFTTRTVSNAVGYDPRFTGIANKPGTSTWWIAGTLSNGTRSAYVFKSTDDGVSWGSGVQVTTNGFTDRAGNPSSYPTSNAYLNGGISIAYKDGILLLGGNQVLRSVDEGSTWSTVSTGLIEVADFSLDQETVWLAVGSSLYPSSIDMPYMGDATTIVYSIDQGVTWSPSVSPFVRNAYQVLYAQNAWMVVGLNGPSLPYRTEVYVSFDGVNWSSVLNSPTYFAFTTDVYPLGPLAPIGFDETDWKLIDAFTGVIDTHSYETDFLSGWTSAPLTGGSLSGATSSSRFYSYVAQTIDPGADTTTITFPLPNTGPTFTSPAQTTFVLWQYMPIPTITFLAPGATAYFVSALPVGLTWDPMTRTITGAAVRTGTQTFTVYAQNSGLTALVITLLVEVPRIVKQQSGAGAYTSLLRQYTTVNAAQNARDTRAFPTQVRGIGEFASPYPPDVITPSNCPC